MVTDAWRLQKVLDDCISEEVILTGFSDKKTSGLLCGPQKSGRNNGGGRMAGFPCSLNQIE